MTVQSSLKLAVDGHPAAIALLIQRLTPRIDSMARFYARCCGIDSDDLRQDAWIALIEALPNLNLAIGVPEQHLICRARWRMLDCVRRTRARTCESLDSQFHVAVYSATSMAGLPICGGFHRDEFTSAIGLGHFYSQLDPVQRRVVSCLLDGMTWRETAVELGCTSPNIAYHVRRVKKRYLDWSGAD